MRHVRVYALLIFVFGISCKGQDKTDLSQPIGNSKSADAHASHGPSSISRTIELGSDGKIWIASWEGVFQYDGESFTNVTRNVSEARFFSILVDKKGDVWFGSIGSGVYRYDGNSFQNFTTKDGLVNNEIVFIYEDKAGDIWFGANGGVSRYDGYSFRTYMMNGDVMMEEKTGKIFPDLTRPMNEVNAIVEDKTGKFWFATRGNTFVYDGKKFTVVTHQGKPFSNVRTIIEDRKGDVWLGGADGGWRYDGRTFTNFTQNFVGYIYEDKKGNIWTSANAAQGWVLSRYDEKSLSENNPKVTEVTSKEGGLFGISEDDNGNIWFGAGDGVYRYDGNTITDFKSNERLK